MTRRAMCDSRPKIQEAGRGPPQQRFNGNQMSESESPAKVEIYTKWGCGFCSRAKALLTGKGVAFEEIDITMGGPKRDERLARSNGGTTVPIARSAGTRRSSSPRKGWRTAGGQPGQFGPPTRNVETPPTTARVVR